MIGNILNKIIFAGLLLTLFFYSCSNNKNNNDLNNAKLRGEVKSVIENKYSAKDNFGIIEKWKFWNRHVFVYNTNGNLISDDEYSEIGGSQSHYKNIYNYDSAGIKSGYNRYETDGSLSGIEIYKYDNNGNLIEEIGKSAFSSKSILKYDNRGFLIERKDSILDTDLGNVYYSNDEKGNIKVKKEGNGYYSTYSYDKDGNKIEEKNYQPDGSLISDVQKPGISNTFKLEHKYSNYDKKGNWLKKTTIQNGYKAWEIIEREIEYY